jgi:hypothetical protein
MGKFILHFKNLKKNQTKLKVFRPLSNVCDFQKESWDFGKGIYTLGYGFKIYKNSIAYPGIFISALTWISLTSLRWRVE